MRTILLLTLLVLAGQALPSGAAAAGWEHWLIVSSSGAENRLAVGEHPEATDGRDGRFDVPALLAGELQAWLKSGNGSLWRDIRGSGPGEERWELLIAVERPGTPVRVTWKTPDLPGGRTLQLVDPVTERQVDMARAGDYELTVTDTARLLLVAGSEER